MESILLEIITELKAAGELDDKAISRILQRHNRAYSQHAAANAKAAGETHLADSAAANAQPGQPANAQPGRVTTAVTQAYQPTTSNAKPRRFAKKHLMPFYLKVKNNAPDTWAAWNLDAQQEEALLRALRMKPRRTASGVATITVITKPWPCGSNCLYCPNDVRMPKSYLSDEPACQRAERNFFDPYLQVASRLRALEQMGHDTDKVELIILGGTWSDYPESYQIWFIHELFRALNDAGRANCWNGDIKSVANRDGNADPERDGNCDVEFGEENPVEKTMRERRSLYETWGILSERSELQSFAHSLQHCVNAGELTYNQAVAALYDNSPWRAASASQHATLAQLEEQHRINENARHRVVGLVVETRPDAVNPNALTMLRRLGCTKVQMGIQSLNPDTLQANSRGTTLASIQRAFALLRLFGFKTHAHFMVNLLGATPEKDKADYAEFVTHPAYLPDEVKLYPCVLVEGTGLCRHYADGSWQPYTEEELVDVLAADVLATPPFTRVSRMIRDISAHDIKAGNKKTNLRQMVESRIEHTEGGPSVREIRYREIGTDGADGAVEMQILKYETTATEEFFLQWVTPENRIAGFLRLSLPHESALSQYEGIPVFPEEAMIREVHVYGKAAKLHASGDSHEGAQHLGLGKRLVEKACSIARERGFRRINVISAVGTREYYRALGFMDGSLYQSKNL